MRNSKPLNERYGDFRQLLHGFRVSDDAHRTIVITA
jgi:hypothetical protein